jgi:hypothetical protein
MSIDTATATEARQEVSEMSEAYLTNWSFGGETPDTRNHFHEIAIREARIASDYRDVEPSAPVRDGFITRLRLAFAGPSAVDACNCPA